MTVSIFNTMFPYHKRFNDLLAVSKRRKVIRLEIHNRIMYRFYIF